MHEPEGMDQITAHLDRGWDLVAEGDWARARVSARAVLALDPDHPEGLTMLGLAELGDGDLEAALEAFDAARESDPGFVAPILYGAETLARDPERLDEALGRIAQVYELLEPGGPELAEVVLLHTELLLEAEDVEAAKTQLGRIDPRDVQDRDQRVRLARAALELDEDDLAAALLSPLAPLALTDELPSEAVYALAQLAERREDQAGAAALYVRVRDLDARGLEPERLPAPEEIEALAKAAIARLPEERRAQVLSAQLRVKDLPAEELVADGLDPWTPLLATAPPSPKEMPESRPRAFHLFLYRANLRLDGLDPEARVARIAEHLMEALDYFGA